MIVDQKSSAPRALVQSVSVQAQVSFANVLEVKRKAVAVVILVAGVAVPVVQRRSSQSKKRKKSQKGETKEVVTGKMIGERHQETMIEMRGRKVGGMMVEMMIETMIAEMMIEKVIAEMMIEKMIAEMMIEKMIATMTRKTTGKEERRKKKNGGKREAIVIVVSAKEFVVGAGMYRADPKYECMYFSIYRLTRHA